MCNIWRFNEGFLVVGTRQYLVEILLLLLLLFLKYIVMNKMETNLDRYWNLNLYFCKNYIILFQEKQECDSQYAL